MTGVSPRAVNRTTGITLRILIPVIVMLGSALTVRCQRTEPLQTPFHMDVPSLPEIPARTADIRDFGAVEGGTHKNTEAIRNAIVWLAGQGGGAVVIPSGRWLTGAVHLESHIALHLAKNAVLLFSQDPLDYLPVVFSRHEDTECYKFSAFIYADGKTDIAITGEGILHGQGKPWWSWKTERKDLEAELVAMGDRGVPVAQRVFDGTDGRGLRPAFFQPMRCTRVLVEGVSFLYGAFWTITPTYCEDVTVRNVTIETSGAYGKTPNGDGMDPSSCRNVLIEHCSFATGDDCIALKSGRDRDGLRVGKPTENVVIRDCRGRVGHGGIVIGSETAGGIRNILAHDCSFVGTDRIVRIKTQRGRGGDIAHMWFRNLTGDSIKLEAIHLNMLYSGTRLPALQVNEATPQLHDIHFSNIALTSGQGYAIEILGLPEMPVAQVTFDSLSLTSVRGVNISDAREVQLRNTRVTPKDSPAVHIAFSRGILLENVAAPDSIRPFAVVEGVETDSVMIRGKDCGVRIAQEVPLGAVQIEHEPDVRH